MTDHLDDVLLSASLDGERTGAVDMHLSACEVCRARRDELARAAAAIGTPVTRIDDARREAAIAAAVGRSPIVERRSRRTLAIPTWSWAAAAVVLALVVVLPLVVRSPGRDDADMDASGPVEDSALRSEAGDTAASAAPTPIDAGDLGVLDDATLRDRVTAHLTGQQATTLGGGATGATVGPACESSLRTQDATLGVLRLFGRATIDGQAVELLVFAVPDAEPLTLRTYAVAVDDCTRIVRFVSFPEPG